MSSCTQPLLSTYMWWCGNCCFALWAQSLDVLPVHVWVLSGYPGFLPPTFLSLWYECVLSVLCVSMFYWLVFRIRSIPASSSRRCSLPLPHGCSCLMMSLYCVKWIIPGFFVVLSFFFNSSKLSRFLKLFTVKWFWATLQDNCVFNFNCFLTHKETWLLIKILIKCDCKIVC